jgi:GNAT superfamily N-acetyltransferase
LPAIVRLFGDDELSAKSAAHVTLADAHYAAFDVIDADPNNHVFVAELDGAVVGTFQLTFIRQLSYGGCLVAQVESVHVDSTVRSRGVGKVMMEHARVEAARRGALRLQLTSNVKRERAHRFYERIGYRATHKGMKLQLEPPATQLETEG